MDDQLHSLRKLDSTYEFSVDVEDSNPTITVKVWEVLGRDVDPTTKFEAELSHTIQNSKQAEPYSPIRAEASARAAFESAVDGFMLMYDGPTVKIELRKDV